MVTPMFLFTSQSTLEQKLLPLLLIFIENKNEVTGLTGAIQLLCVCVFICEGKLQNLEFKYIGSQ